MNVVTNYELFPLQQIDRATKHDRRSENNKISY